MGDTEHARKVAEFIAARGGVEGIKVAEGGRQRWSWSREKRFLNQLKLQRAIGELQRRKREWEERRQALKDEVMVECGAEAEGFLEAKGIVGAAKITVEVVANLIYLMRNGSPSAVQLKAAEYLGNIDGRLGLKATVAAVQEEEEEGGEGKASVGELVAEMMGDPEFRAEVERQRVAGGLGDGKEGSS